MKTIGIILILTLLFSCNKEEISTGLISHDNESQQNALNNVPKISNPYNIEMYTINISDADDEKINGHLLKIGIAIRDLIKDNSYNALILNSARENAINCMNLFELAADPRFKSSGGQYEKFITAIKNADLTHRSQNPMKSGEVEEYIPAIYVPNIEIADFELQPLICPGFEVNSELQDMQEYEDYIVAWYYDGEGTLNEIIISEETAMSTTNPIFIIVNAEEYPVEKTSRQTDNKEPYFLKSSNTSTQYHSCEYQINYRYENSGNSEFCIAAALIDENGTGHNILQDNGIRAWKKIAEVDKNDIGKLLSHWEQLCSYDVLPFSNNWAYFNTFERDWYASFKYLGSATAYGTTINLAGEMKFSNEWYAYDPNQVRYNSIDFQYIYSNWAKWHDNSKGRFRLWRVE